MALRGIPEVDDPEMLHRALKACGKSLPESRLSRRGGTSDSEIMTPREAVSFAHEEIKAFRSRLVRELRSVETKVYRGPPR